MNTAAERDAYFAEVMAMKHRRPTAQEEAWAHVNRTFDAETGGPFVSPPWVQKNEEKGERENKEEGGEKEESGPDQRPGPGRPGLASGEETSTHAKDSTMQMITTTDAALVLSYGKALERYPDEQARIRKGAKIAALPFEIKEHGTYALVPSSKGDKEYTVNGACQCQDYHAQLQNGLSGRCKHRFAVSLHRKAATMHKGMLAPENQFCAMVGTESGIVHKVEKGFFFVPYGGPRGRFITSVEYVLGSQGTDWPAVQEEKERWEAAYYEEYGEIA